MRSVCENFAPPNLTPLYEKLSKHSSQLHYTPNIGSTLLFLQLLKRCSTKNWSWWSCKLLPTCHWLYRSILQLLVVLSFLILYSFSFSLVHYPMILILFSFISYFIPFMDSFYISYYFIFYLALILLVLHMPNLFFSCTILLVLCPHFIYYRCTNIYFLSSNSLLRMDSICYVSPCSLFTL